MTFGRDGGVCSVDDIWPSALMAGLIPLPGGGRLAGKGRPKIRKRLKKYDNPLPGNDSSPAAECKFRAAGNVTARGVAAVRPYRRSATSCDFPVPSGVHSAARDVI